MSVLTVSNGPGCESCCLLREVDRPERPDCGPRSLPAFLLALGVLAGLLGAFLTAYYAFRLIFILMFPKPDRPASPAETAHGHTAEHNDSHYWVMVWPLIILAAVTAVLGLY